jgi:hypothetical protein
MLRFARWISISILLVLVNLDAFAVDPSAANQIGLDGLQFKGKTGEQGKEEHHEDTIVFENGQFRSLDCESWGFGSAPYSVRKDGDSYHFKAALPSSDRGTLEWHGTITGDVATATFHWFHERWYWNIDRQYWFEGTRYSGQ